MMYEIDKEDTHKECYYAVYSAENFYRNMRQYYSHVAGLYFRSPSESDPLSDIIGSIPPSCMWITLILEDMDRLSGKAEKMREVIESVFAFADKNASIILVGDGDYKKTFAGCEYALSEMEQGIAANFEDDHVSVGCYDQEDNSERETVTYETADDRRRELNFYWDIVNTNLKKGYLDYSGFKALYKETLEYIIPRVTLEQVYRKDIAIIQKLFSFHSEKLEEPEGCAPWEYDAAREFSRGLDWTLENPSGLDDDLTGDKIEIGVTIIDAEKHHGGVHISGYTHTGIEINADTACSAMDKLADTIHEVSYNGNDSRVLEYLLELDAEKKGLESVPKEKEEAVGKLDGLMDSLLEAADKTVNREPGRKVRRYKGNKQENG